MAVSGATPSTASAFAGQAVPAVRGLADLVGRQGIAATVVPTTVAPADQTGRRQEIAAIVVLVVAVRADLTVLHRIAADRGAVQAAAERRTSAKLAVSRNTPLTG